MVDKVDKTAQKETAGLRSELDSAKEKLARLEKELPPNESKIAECKQEIRELEAAAIQARHGVGSGAEIQEEQKEQSSLSEGIASVFSPSTQSQIDDAKAMLEMDDKERDAYLRQNLQGQSISITEGNPYSVNTVSALTKQRTVVSDQHSAMLEEFLSRQPEIEHGGSLALNMMVVENAQASHHGFVAINIHKNQEGAVTIDYFDPRGQTMSDLDRKAFANAYGENIEVHYVNHKFERVSEQKLADHQLLGNANLSLKACNAQVVEYLKVTNEQGFSHDQLRDRMESTFLEDPSNLMAKQAAELVAKYGMEASPDLLNNPKFQEEIKRFDQEKQQEEKELLERQKREREELKGKQQGEFKQLLAKSEAELDHPSRTLSDKENAGPGIENELTAKKAAVADGKFAGKPPSTPDVSTGASASRGQ